MREQPIRDAASLVLLDHSGPEPRVLMGRRSPGQVFLPNVFVFPGGRVDDGDHAAPSGDELEPDEAALLALPRDGHAPYGYDAVRAFAMAAIRETFEETGLAIGRASTDATRDASDNAVWMRFLQTGIVPQLSGLQYFLRAVTPPGRPRRYDTRFFLADAGAIGHRGAVIDDELSEIGWFDLATLGALDVPTMTRRVIVELGQLVRDGLAPAARRTVPFYHHQNGIMARAELSLAAARS